MFQFENNPRDVMSSYRDQLQSASDSGRLDIELTSVGTCKCY
jgi:hypothetical protein